jgi:phosphocarrier protein HPr
MSSAFVTASIVLGNQAGLHARPSVKLTQLAKRFAAGVEVGTDANGPWVDAKSPVKMMRLKVPTGTCLHVRAQGADAGDAVRAIVELVERRFDEDAGEPAPGDGPRDG